MDKILHTDLGRGAFERIQPIFDRIDRSLAVVKALEKIIGGGSILLALISVVFLSEWIMAFVGLVLILITVCINRVRSVLSSVRHHVPVDRHLIGYIIRRVEILEKEEEGEGRDRVEREG